VKIIRLLTAAAAEIPRLVPLMRDVRVPLWAKLATAAAALFIVSPLNVLGDIPLLGLVDDGTLLLFVLHLFVRYAEKSAA
jgi:uncharacterized membrane protein YkvA (DUF1232 family)